MGSEDDNSTYTQEEDETARYFEAVTLLLILLSALIGNITTMTAILGVKSLRQNVHTAFVVNLCIMDLLVCFFSMSFSLVDIFIVGYLEDSDSICRFNCFMAMFALYGNFSGVTLIAVNRCIGIVYPTVIKLKRRHALVMIACSWVYSFTIAIPTTYHKFPAEATYNNGTHHCSPAWKGPGGVYNIICIVLLYGVTAPVMVVSYTLIIREIRKREAEIKKYSDCRSEGRVKTVEANITNRPIFSMFRNRTLETTGTTELVSFSKFSTESIKHSKYQVSQGNAGSDVMIGPYHDVNVLEQNDKTARDRDITLSIRNYKIETVDRRIVMARGAIVVTNFDEQNRQKKTSNRIASNRIGTDKRVALAGCLLILTSTLCWAPYFIVHAIVGNPSHGLGVFSMWMGYANSALDPFIYSFLSQRIRTAVKEMLSKMLRKGR